MNDSIAFTADRKSLHETLKGIARTVERRNTIPILSHILFTVERDKLTLTGTDLDMMIIAEFPVATDEGGALGAYTVEAKLVVDTLKKMTGDCVRFVEGATGKVDIECVETGARFAVPMLSANDFPHLKPYEPVASFELPGLQLRATFDSVKGAMSTEETRYYLQGIFMHATCDQPPARTEEHEKAVTELATLRKLKCEAERAEVAGEPFEGDLPEGAAERLSELGATCDRLEAERCAPNVLRMAATDGHRLTRATLALPDGAAGLPDVLVPRKAVTIVHAMLGGKGGDVGVAITVHAQQVTFQFNRFRIVTKTIDGTFPDYTRVIPTQNDRRLTVDSATLKGAIETVTAVASERTRAVLLSIVPGQPLIASCTSPENGKAAMVVGGESGGSAFDQEPYELPIGFNAKYLAEALSAFTGDVVFELSDPAAPTLIRGDARPELITVLMPMRVGESVMTVDGVKRLNMNALELLQAELPTLLASIASVRDVLPSLTRPYRAQTWAAAQRRLGDKVKAAVAFVARRRPHAEARQIVKALVAVEAGDDAAYGRAMLYGHALKGGAARAYGGIAFEAEPTPAAEPVECVQDLATVENEPQDPAPVESPEPVEPDHGGEAVELETEEAEAAVEPVAEAQPEPTPAVDQAAPQALPDEPVAKVETVYGHVIFVLESDWLDESRTFLHRVDKRGVYLCDPESKGGSRKRVLRANISRRILPRVKSDQPVVRAAPKVDATAERVDELAAQLAALQATVALLTSGQPVATPTVQPVARTRSAAHLRAIMAYLKLRSTRHQIRNLCESIGVANRQWLEATEATAAAERRAAKVDAAIECRDIALADVDQARAERDEALSTVGRLTVRCEALERLAVTSAAVDRRPADNDGEAKPVIILPVPTAGKRQSA